ncbi:type-1 angiotensin II receptor-like [Polyodon spathula]|uniref:type-1 angiotensin II receptor-like n=1 Tax=Polyodon spathula TaxID=7913 RepID=UPI001B7E78D0|nr:type-1 angiotensin II receptor-like [Polyodon spathula]
MENSTAGPTEDLRVSVNCTSSGMHNYIFTMIPIVYSFIFVVGVLGNSMVVAVIYSYVKIKTVANVFMLNLALADLTFLITLPLWAAYTALGYNWHFGGFLCKLSTGLVTFNLYATIFLLTCLSIDRYVAIVHPVRSRPRRTLVYSRITCIIIWVFAFVLSVPTMCFRDVVLIANPNISVCAFLYKDANLNRFLVGMGFVKSILGFLIPFVIIITCYCLIGKTLLGAYQVQKSKARNDEVLKMLAAIVASFFICWVPYQIFHFMDILVHLKVIKTCKLIDIVDTALPFTICIAYFNSCLNPILYGFVKKHFRRKLLQLLKCASPLKAHPSLSTKISSISYRGSENLHLKANKSITLCDDK